MPGDRDDLVVFCGSTFWSGIRMFDQNMAEALTAYAPVLYVDPPVSALTRFRNPAAAAAQGRGLRQVGPRLSVLSPRVLPLKERPGGKQLALAATRRAMARAVDELGSPSVRAVIVPSLNPLFGVLGEAHRVFYATDDFLAGASLMGISQRRLVRRARQQPKDADIVVAVSPVLADRLAAQGADPILIPNGCDAEHFATAGTPPAESEPVAAFMGHLSDRVDVRFLEAVAATGAALRIIGPRQETMSAGHFDVLLSMPNVTWSGYLPYQDLPEALTDVTTCLLPYRVNDFNQASFPLKMLEYLAAGRRVVSTPLPAVDWLGTSFITTAATPATFAEAVTQSLSTPLNADEVAARRAFASGHTWADRARVLAQAIGLVGSASAAHLPGARA